MSDNQHRLLAYLWRAQGWVTAAELSVELGVTPRSVRSYVSAVKTSSHPLEVISSSADGYRLNPGNYARFIGDSSTPMDRSAAPASPAERGRHLVRRLASAPQGIDLYTLAAALFVGESTLEADLRRLRHETEPFAIGFTRNANQLRLTGTEVDLRGLLARMFRTESPPGFLSLTRIERAFGLSDLAGFERALEVLLAERGLVVNGFAVNDVLLHLAVAVSRTRIAGPTVPSVPASASASVPASASAVPSVPASAPASASASAPASASAGAGGSPRKTPDPEADTDSSLSTELARLVARRFDVSLSPVDQRYLATLVTTRSATRAAGENSAGGIRSTEQDLVEAIVRRIAEHFSVELNGDAFSAKLSLHVQNLVGRAREHNYSRNPMARTIKITYPLIYEIAVFAAHEIGREMHIAMGDDEISYLALHVGAALERSAPVEEPVTCTVICPGYHGLHLQLMQRLDKIFGSELKIDSLIARAELLNPQPDVPGSDLVLTTVATLGSAAPRAGTLVSIHPFLTENDVISVRQAVGGVRRRRRRAPLRAALLGLFEPALFERNLEAGSPEELIRILGDRMITAGVIGPETVNGAIVRETLSSTAFTDTLAVPHPFEPVATRSAISIAVNETAVQWGGSQVNVVAFLALAPGDQAIFCGVFNQLISAFADHDEAARIIRRSVDFASFISEFGRVFDS